MTREEELEARVRKLEAENAYLKIGGPEGGRDASNRVKASVVASLSGEHSLGEPAGCARLARSSYYYALAHPKQPTRPELWEKVAEVFSRAPNGCGHRQIAMCLRAELGAAVADKTVLKIMGEMGIRCGIRRETDRRRYSSYKGVVGETFENVLARDFAADGPWQKMPDGAHPILHSDSKNVASRFCGGGDAAVSCNRDRVGSILTRTPIDGRPASASWPAQRSTPCHSPEYVGCSGRFRRRPPPPRSRDPRRARCLRCIPLPPCPAARPGEGAQSTPCA